MSKIAIIGTGYVGLVTGTCLANSGHYVTCVDNDEDRIQKLNNGIIPIYEPGLEEMIIKNCDLSRLKFAIDIKNTIEENNIIFITVGTPSDGTGGIDLQYIKNAVRDIAKYMNGYKLIVSKSTVPVGTCKNITQIIREVIAKKGIDYEFDVVYNPEFLREGSAVNDFINPDRIVLGTESEKAEMIVREIYKSIYQDEIPFIITDIETAEMVKFAANGFLAVKITYINEIANLCEKVGANIGDVTKAMGMDERIGSRYLNPGPGYGGSCFPKDTCALSKIGHEHYMPVTLIDQVITANEFQKCKMVQKIMMSIGDIKNRTIGVLGITFKPDTDDIREAPSLTIIDKLVKEGAFIKIYDPQWERIEKKLNKYIEGKYTFCDNEYSAVRDADAVVLITEWDQFKNMDLDRIINGMKDRYFFDLRNLYERKAMEEKGFKYYCVGR